MTTRPTAEEAALDASAPSQEDRAFSLLGDLPPVRGFFVEPDAWMTLEDVVIEPLVRAKVPGEPIRAWVPGAGTGESAYATAMLLLERLEAEGKECPVQIFATDTRSDLRAVARSARYSAALLQHVSPERRRRFFSVEGDGQTLVVVPPVRRLVYFGSQKVRHAVPLHGVDLVCCVRDFARLPAEERAALIRLLQRAPRRGGHLFLGSSGHLGDGDTTLTVSRSWGIQRSLDGPPGPAVAIVALFDEVSRLTWSRVVGTGRNWLAPFPRGTSLSDLGARFADRGLGDDVALVRAGHVVRDREIDAWNRARYTRRVVAGPDGILVSYVSAPSVESQGTMAFVGAELERLVSMRAQQSTLLNDALRITNRAQSFAQALRESLECVCANLGWPLAHVWIRGPGGRFGDGGIWSRCSGSGFARFRKHSRRAGFAAGDPTSLGAVARDGQPLWVADVTDDPALCRSGEDLIDARIAGALLVPIVQGPSTIGVLEFFTPERTPPPKVISDGLAELGAQLGVIRDREQNQQAMHVLVSERLLTEQRERNKLAKNLHDDLGQVLALARMRLDDLRASVPEKADGIEQISALLAQANETVRSLSFRLSPPVLHELGLVPALEWLAESLPVPAGMRIDVRSPGGDLAWLPESDRVILFRSVRELVINAVKHSHGRLVRVDVRRARSLVTIAVSDDGVGFSSAEAAGASGFGLTSVRESLAHVGGRLSLSARAGPGTRVTIHFPVREGPP